MTKEFVPYELAVKLKALGFNEPCFGFYLEDGTWTPASYSREGTVFPSNSDLLPEWCTAPLYQQAFRWFREKYDLFISIFHYENGYALNNLRRFDTHEEAEVALLTSLIELAESMV